jgi:hypothetical protein
VLKHPAVISVCVCVCVCERERVCVCVGGCVCVEEGEEEGKVITAQSRQEGTELLRTNSTPGAELMHKSGFSSARLPVTGPNFSMTMKKSARGYRQSRSNSG